MIINKMLKAGLVTIIPHGITDIVDCPKKTLITYSLVNPIIINLSTETKIYLLLASSIYHLRNDVPGYLLGSSILHNLWLMYPPFSIFYLSCVHTPRHYDRVFKKVKNKKLKLSLIGLMTIVSFYGIRLEPIITTYLGNYWWIGPILSHIIITEIH
jgi:hypothetical protein